MGYKDIKLGKKAGFLITGGAGFIGSNLCEAILQMGHKVRCLDNFSTGKKENIGEWSDHPDFELVTGDIRDFDTCIRACENMDFVLHQAAIGSVPRSIEMPVVYEEINICGTLNMLEAARHAKIKKFVYASSSSVYGNHPALPKREGQEGDIISPYALTKKTNEEYAKLYTKLYGLDTYGLRYFNVFGRRQDPNGAYAAVIPKFIKSLRTSKAPTIYGDGTQSRDFTYIENVIEANLKACIAPTKYAGECFNIACGEQISLIALCEKLCELLDRQITPVYASHRPGDIKHSSADISKAKAMLGYDPDYRFGRGIELAVGWYVSKF